MEDLKSERFDRFSFEYDRKCPSCPTLPNRFLKGAASKTIGSYRPYWLHIGFLDLLRLNMLNASQRISTHLGHRQAMLRRSAPTVAIRSGRGQGSGSQCLRSQKPGSGRFRRLRPDAKVMHGTCICQGEKKACISVFL